MQNQNQALLIIIVILLILYVANVFPPNWDTWIVIILLILIGWYLYRFLVGQNNNNNNNINERFDSIINKVHIVEVSENVPNGYCSRNDKNECSNVLAVAPGDTVVWTNRGNQVHTVKSNTGEFDSGNIQPGQSFQLTFENKGTYYYTCSLHPDKMNGIIRVQ